jgi:hypothetical protein
LRIANRDRSKGRIGLVQAFLPSLNPEQNDDFYIQIESGKPAVKFNINNPIHVNASKNLLIKMLNGLGIQFSIDDLNYMLEKKYGSSDA